MPSRRKRWQNGPQRRIQTVGATVPAGGWISGSSSRWPTRHWESGLMRSGSFLSSRIHTYSGRHCSPGSNILTHPNLGIWANRCRSAMSFSHMVELGLSSLNQPWRRLSSIATRISNSMTTSLPVIGLAIASWAKPWPTLECPLQWAFPTLSSEEPADNRLRIRFWRSWEAIRGVIMQRVITIFRLLSTPCSTLSSRSGIKTVSVHLWRNALETTTKLTLIVF